LAVGALESLTDDVTAEELPPKELARQAPLTPNPTNVEVRAEITRRYFRPGQSVD
jgi:hypothetical protein